MVNMVDNIINLERQGVRFAPRQLNGISRFDYKLSSPLTKEQSNMLIELKQDEGGVCAYLVSRAKLSIEHCRSILERDGDGYF